MDATTSGAAQLIPLVVQWSCVVTTTDPQQNDYPDKLASCLDVSGDGSQFPTCVTFNAQGTYMAVGTNTGTCIIVDYDTLGVAKQLRGHTRPITSVW